MEQFSKPLPYLVIVPAILNQQNHVSAFAYAIDLYSFEPLSRFVYYIDANTLEIIFKEDKIDPAVYGKIINQKQFDRLTQLVKDSIAQGALLEWGGQSEVISLTILPTLLRGVSPENPVMKEEIFGPVLAVTTFKDEAEALAIANDTVFGLGSGVWTRDGSRAYRMGRGIKAGRVWTNCYHAYPAHAAFGGYKESGIGRETHKMMLDHYQQTKNLLVSYSPKKLGFF